MKAQSARAKAKPDVGRVLFALADPTRRLIVEQLGRGSSTVTALSEPLGVTVTAVRQHLHILEGCRLVRTEKLGRVRTCQIEPEGLDTLVGWVDRQRLMWARRLDVLGDILNEGSDT
jgi:DNA-binding transcriptional ArsR family regulator